jgi:hypothetical protein
MSTNSAARGQSSQSDRKPNPRVRAMTMEAYQAEKRRRLDRLRDDTKANERAFMRLSADTREAQLKKALDLTEANPLQRDEGERYCLTMARLQRRYLAGRR